MAVEPLARPFLPARASAQPTAKYAGVGRVVRAAPLCRRTFCSRRRLRALVASAVSPLQVAEKPPVAGSATHRAGLPQRSERRRQLRFGYPATPNRQTPKRGAMSAISRMQQRFLGALAAPPPMVRRSVARLTARVPPPIQIVPLVKIKPAQPFIQPRTHVVNARSTSRQTVATAVFRTPL